MKNFSLPYFFIKELYYYPLHPTPGLINKKIVKRKGLQNTMSVRLPPITKFAAGE